MSLDYSDIKVRQKVIETLNEDGNKKRKATSLRQFRCYSDNLDQYVQERLLQSFSRETFQMMPVISSINLVKRIVDQSSTIYSMKPKRTFSELDPDQMAVVEDIYADAGIDNQLLRANRFYSLQGQTHLYIKLMDGHLKAVPLLAHNIDVIPNPDDPETADAYIIANFDKYDYTLPPTDYNQVSSTGYRGTSDAGYIAPNYKNTVIGDTEDYRSTAARYTFWSKDFNFVCNGKGEIVSDPGDLENPLGIISIIDISQFKDFTYFIQQGSGVVEFCIDYNVALTDLMFISRLQGFAQGVVTGDKEVLDKMTTIQLGPAHLIKLPNSPVDGKATDLRFINRGSDIKGSQESIEMLLSNFLTSKGIDPKVISGKGESQKFSSGTERLLAMIDRFESSRADYDLFLNVERELWEIVKTYLNKYSGTEYLEKEYWTSIPEEADVSVQYAKPELVQGEAEKVDTVIKKMEAGLLSKIEAIQELRGVNQQQAEEILQNIRQDLMPQNE